MAATQLADVIVPAVFTDYMQQLSTENNAFVQSGVVGPDSLLDALLVGGGRIFNVPKFVDLANTEANISSDNPASPSTPQNIGTEEELAIRNSRNQSWSSMDLVQALIGPDPMDAIARLVAGYWTRQDERILIASTQGIIADNIANDSGDMVVDITAGVGAVTAANLFSAEAFIDAAFTMGDAQDELVAVAMHSVVFSRAQKNNLIDFIPDARGEVQIPTFLGRRVVVDDVLPVVANGPNFEYSTYLFGLGSFGLGSGAAKVPTEVDRAPEAGDGGGQETLFSRREWILHPRGFAWLATPGSGQVGQSPDNAELAAAANWDRRTDGDRKIVKIAELRTNG